MIRHSSILVLLIAPLFAQTALAETPSVDFRRDIQPILAGKCFKCHGPDEESREADLRLDTHAGATAEADSGEPAIVPGDANGSEFLRRLLTDDEDERMPPAENGPALDERQIAMLRQWINDGAQYQRHWSFDPPQSKSPPEIKHTNWARSDLDRFVLARLETAGLGPTAEADRATLIRRLSLDLIGLPPSVEEVDAFLADTDPLAYENLVDRLLGSPRYGERWARVWLDLARYADSQGYAQDSLRPMWSWRDWVIRALNDNMPFDQFTIEQIAGDMLPEPTQDQLIATGFHRNTMTNTEGGTDDEEFRVAAVVDRVSTTMQVWMGLTMGCAQCHSHKYEPISHHEYYQFYAILNQTADADRMDEEPRLWLSTPEQAEKRSGWKVELGKLEKEEETEEIKEQKKELIKKLQALSGQIIKTSIMRELPTEQHRKTQVMIRGNFLALGDEVQPGVPEMLHALPAGRAADRLALAEWLVAKENPLTARVTANRLWEQLFGIGLVETSEDFGSQGEPPSHPQLLDWLALELVRSDWNLKAMLKTIVTSSTYRQSSNVSAQVLAADPRNRLMSRGPRFRLDAETVRDQALAIGGLLSEKMHGRPVRPPEPRSNLKSAFGGKIQGETAKGEDRYRRGVYTLWRRTSPYPSMVTFDAPSREVCTVRRIPTNTPLQALVIMNDEVYVEAAQAMARRILSEGGDSIEDQASYAFRLCTARTPTDQERKLITDLYYDAIVEYRLDDEAARLMATQPLGPIPEGMSLPEVAAWTLVGNNLLNLDETLARR